MTKPGKKAQLQELKTALSAVSALQGENVELREDLRQIAQAYDTQGWALVSGFDDPDNGLKLETILNFSKTNRALLGFNPLIKKASGIRAGYVHGEGIQFKGTQTRHDEFIEAHYERLYSEQAGEELESAWNTDGQVFFLLDAQAKEVIRIPMSEISGVATSARDKERILYIQRTWREDVPGHLRGEMKRCWYPVDNLRPSERVRLSTLEDQHTESKATLDETKAILHVPVNRQTGWTWGLPDVQSVVFWVKAYKEFMEDNYKLVRSLARYTWKITAPSSRAVSKAAAKVAAAPAMDPITGRTADAGGTAAMGPGYELAAVNKAGANVNFEAGRPLAALVAAGMEVPVDQLLAAKGTSADEKLDAPTLKKMMNRQALVRRMHTRIFRYIFGEAQAKKIQVVTPPIQDEPLHRVIQAIVTGATTNTLHVTELREMLVLALRKYGITALPGLPKAGAYAQHVGGAVNENPGTSPSNPPGGTNSGVSRSPAGALADGDHEQRKSEALSMLLSAVEALKTIDN